MRRLGDLMQAAGIGTITMLLGVMLIVSAFSGTGSDVLWMLALLVLGGAACIAFGMLYHRRSDGFGKRDFFVAAGWGAIASIFFFRGVGASSMW